jgi:hypothetical protein
LSRERGQRFVTSGVVLLLVHHQVREADAPVRAHHAEGDLAGLEQSDQERPRDVQQLGRLECTQLCVCRHYRYPIAHRQVAKQLGEQFQRFARNCQRHALFVTISAHSNTGRTFIGHVANEVTQSLARFSSDGGQMGSGIINLHTRPSSGVLSKCNRCNGLSRHVSPRVCLRWLRDSIARRGVLQRGGGRANLKRQPQFPFDSAPKPSDMNG